MFTLGQNELVGTVPSEIGALTAATLLHIQNNNLSGVIPSEVGHLTGMTLSLSLRNNQLSGTIPTELGRLSLLPELLLGNNKLSGSIPSEFGLLSSMGMLGLQRSSLTGTIPTQLVEIQSSLYSLLLDGNPLLSGTVPEGLCNLNGTCFDGPRSLKPCSLNFYGLYVDCTSQLCGCECSACAAGEENILGAMDHP